MLGRHDAAEHVVHECGVDDVAVARAHGDATASVLACFHRRHFVPSKGGKKLNLTIHMGTISKFHYHFLGTYFRGLIYRSMYMCLCAVGWVGG